MNELSDYLKANCRSWEIDCNNEPDTLDFAIHLSTRFPEIPFEQIYETSKNWTGYEPELSRN